MGPGAGPGDAGRPQVKGGTGWVSDGGLLRSGVSAQGPQASVSATARPALFQRVRSCAPAPAPPTLRPCLLGEPMAPSLDTMLAVGKEQRGVTEELPP